jgi:hypothetical protein
MSDISQRLVAAKPSNTQTVLLIPGLLDAHNNHNFPVTIAVYMSSSWRIALQTRDYEIGAQHEIFLLESNCES